LRTHQIVGLGETPDKTTALRFYLEQMEVLEGFYRIHETTKPAFELGHDELKLIGCAVDPDYFSLQNDALSGKQVIALFLGFDQ
jgi:hypothetical protein